MQAWHIQCGVSQVDGAHIAATTEQQLQLISAKKETNGVKTALKKHIVQRLTHVFPQFTLNQHPMKKTNLSHRDQESCAFLVSLMASGRIRYLQRRGLYEITQLQQKFTNLPVHKSTIDNGYYTQCPEMEQWKCKIYRQLPPHLRVPEHYFNLYGLSHVRHIQEDTAETPIIAHDQTPPIDHNAYALI